MGHEKRIGELERAARRLALDQWCAECGGISRNSRRIIVVPHHPYEFPTCSTCGLMLDKDGRPFGTLNEEGKQTVKLLVLQDGDPADVLPGDPGSLMPPELQG